MVKIHYRTMGAIIVLLMLGTSQLSATFAFAEFDENQGKNGQNDPKKDRLGAILTEKIIDGKLKVQKYSLPDDTSDEDLQRIVSMEGKTTGWAYVNYKAYNSGIVLFDGKASKSGENLWKITTNSKLNLENNDLNLEPGKKSKESIGGNHEAYPSDEFTFKIIFSGKLAETGEENIYAISLINSSLKNLENGQNMKLYQFGEIAFHSEKPIEHHHGFKISHLVI